MSERTLSDVVRELKQNSVACRVAVDELVTIARQRAHDEAIEKAAKIADAAKLTETNWLAANPVALTAHRAACVEIASAIRALKLTSPSPGKETT